MRPPAALALLLFVACTDDADPPLTTSPTTPTSATNPTATPSTDPTTTTATTSSSSSTDDTSTAEATSLPATSSTSPPNTSDVPGTTTTSDDTTGPDATTSADDTTTNGDALVPPLGGSSGGQGGGPADGAVQQTPTGVQYNLISPGAGAKQCAFIVYSGVEGGQTMTSNLLMVADFTGNGECLFAVLDGAVYNGDGQAGADVLDDLRSKYDVDNDRTYLFSESAGTSAGLELGFQLRQSYFAAFWANDVNATGAPAQDTATLGFQPWGNSGPGGQFATADAIVAAMTTAGYRIEQPAPYDGPGSGTHGDPNQFLAGLQWFPGRTRQ